MRPCSVFVAVLTLMLMAGCPSTGRQSLSQPLPIETAGAYTHPASGISLPPSVGPFRRVSILRYDVQGSDVSAGYNLPDPLHPATATVYVYPAPRVTAIGSPPEVVAQARTAMMQREFDARVEEILRSHAASKLIEVKSVTLVQAGRTYPGVMATFEYEEVFASRRQLLSSRLYLFGYIDGQWDVAYRFSYPKDSDLSGRIDQFMKDWAWMPAGS